MDLYIRFTWDPIKAATNLQKHGVSFPEAIKAFFDTNAIDDFDAEHSDSETRHILIGLSNKRLLFVVYTEHTEGVIRIISARKADGKHRQVYAKRLTD